MRPMGELVVWVGLGPKEDGWRKSSRSGWWVRVRVSLDAEDIVHPHSFSRL